MKKFGGPGKKKKSVKRRCSLIRVIASNSVVSDLTESTFSVTNVFTQCLKDQKRNVYTIQGDSNCMFRAIVSLMNDEEKHGWIRLMIQ